jgi:putative oxidoreductase
MITESHLEFVRTRGSKFGRFLMGFFFFCSGLSMLFLSTPAGTAGFFATLGIPLPLVAAWLAIIIKVGAGGALMIGRYVPQAAALLIIFTLVATAIAHLDFSNQDEMMNALRNLAIVGGLLYMMEFGPDGINLADKE